MRVRKKSAAGEKVKVFPATSAAAAMDPDPVVMLIVSLLTATTMTNDRIPITNRAPA